MGIYIMVYLIVGGREYLFSAAVNLHSYSLLKTGVKENTNVMLLCPSIV